METLRIISLVILILFILVFIICYLVSKDQKERNVILLIMTVFAIPTIYIILNWKGGT